MSDLFDNITTRMDIRKSSVDTTYDKSRSKGRAIKKIPVTITVPSQVVGLGFDSSINGFLVSQYNFTLSESFRLIKVENLKDISIGGPVPTYAVFIKFRVGAVVYRYRIAPLILDAGVSAIYALTGYSNVQGDTYTNQVIQPNFCLEWWRVYQASGFMRSPSYRLTTSLLRLPESADEQSVDTLATVSLARADLALTMPETIPTNYGANNNWLTN